MKNSRHLLGLEDLSAEQILAILESANRYVGVGQHGQAKRDDLKGALVANIFYEPSTRTRTSFSLAARRLGADVVDFSTAGSSTSKGESFLDTAKTIEAMGVDIIVVRHSSSGAPHLLARNLKSAIINAGDGAHEHPTQALLDLFTIQRRMGKIPGLTVGIVGDIAHSRVARSNIFGLKKLGANVVVCGPPTLMPPGIEALGVRVACRLDDILGECDVFNLLRLQTERQQTGLIPSLGEYAALYCMTAERLAKAKSDALVLAPGPINRGVEITSEVADGPRSAILEQVSHGLAVRMAVLNRVFQS
ncbi:MAG: aspartate carbamoyltransferase catalytic subunit [Gemmataceae bacterium]